MIVQGPPSCLYSNTCSSCIVRHKEAYGVVLNRYKLVRLSWKESQTVAAYCTFERSSVLYNKCLIAGGAHEKLLLRCQSVLLALWIMDPMCSFQASFDNVVMPRYLYNDNTSTGESSRIYKTAVLTDRNCMRMTLHFVVFISVHQVLHQRDTASRSDCKIVELLGLVICRIITQSSANRLTCKKTLDKSLM